MLLATTATTTTTTKVAPTDSNDENTRYIKPACFVTRQTYTTRGQDNLHPNQMFLLSFNRANKATQTAYNARAKFMGGDWLTNTHFLLLLSAAARWYLAT